jgi:hypothetical protein
MQRSTLWRRVIKRLLRKHGDVKSFEHEVQSHGRVAGIADTGTRVVPTEKIVGSVSRWRNLRSDFFYRTGTAITERFVRVGKAMQQGKALPPLELYKLKGRRQAVDVSEYYVVDGHHRVAMARKLGQDFLDAHVVEYKVAGPEDAQTPQADSSAPPVEPAAGVDDASTSVAPAGSEGAAPGMEPHRSGRPHP